MRISATTHLLALSATCILSASTAHAAILDVPAQYSTIQAAINAAVNGDEVVVAPGTYLENINFSGKAITVRSSGGAAVTTIKGGAGDRTVRWSSNETRSSGLDGFSVTGGNGGAIVWHAAPTIRNCTFHDCHSDWGGALQSEAGSPLIEDCTFTSNTSTEDGGALYAWSPGIACAPIIRRCAFDENSAGADNRGGALKLHDSVNVVTIEDCTFTANSTGIDAGAVGLAFSNVATLTRCTFEYNVAGWGGAVYVQGGAQATISACSFEHNASTGSGFGGGALAVSDGSLVALTNCDLSENNAANDGGGLWVCCSAQVSATACNLSQNYATWSGGAIRSAGSGTLLTLTECTFTENTAESAGAVSNKDGSHIEVTQSNFDNNVANGDAGALDSSDYDATADLVECRFAANRSLNGNCGAVRIQWNPVATIRGCVFSANVSVNHTAGGLGVGGSNVEISDCVFANNTAGDHGGGAVVQSLWGGVGIVNTTFSDNVATWDNPGLTADSSVAIRNSVLWGDHFPNGVPKETGGGGSPDIQYCDVQGGYVGTGNIDADPLFFDPDNGDYRLGAGSPCIDTGDNASVPVELTTDLGGNPRISDGNDDGGATVDMGAYETVDCNHNALPDWNDIGSGTSSDCNGNEVPDECDIAGGSSQDCDANGIPDECEVPPLGPAANDLNNNGVPDVCEDQSCTNLTTGQVYPTIAEAIAAADAGHLLEAGYNAFDITPTIDFIGKAVTLRSTANITQVVGGLFNLTNGAKLATSADQTLTVRGTLRSAIGATTDVAAQVVIVDSNGLLRARSNSALNVDATGFTRLSGTTSVDANGTLSFTGDVENPGQVTVIGGGTLSATDLFSNAGTLNAINANLYLEEALNAGTLNSPGGTVVATTLDNLESGQWTGSGQVYADLINAGDVVITGSTTFVGDILNESTGEIRLQIGTTTLVGDLTNYGAVVGNFGTRAAGRLDLLGDFTAGADAALRLPDAGTVLAVSGAYDNAIDDYQRFELRHATLELNGVLTPQLVEVMSRDIGPDEAGLDPLQPGHYPVGTLHIGPTATTVQLVDNHDNDGLGQTACEALYVESVIIDAGTTLENPTCKVYYQTLVNHGTVTNSANLKPYGPAVCLGDVNCDGAVTFADIDPFVARLGCPNSNPAACNAGCNWQNADINSDGAVTFADIDPFVGTLGTVCP